MAPTPECFVAPALQRSSIELYKSGKQWQEQVALPSRTRLLQLLLDLRLVQGSMDELLDKSIDRVFMPHSLGHFLGEALQRPAWCLPFQLEVCRLVSASAGTGRAWAPAAAA